MQPSLRTAHQTSPVLLGALLASACGCGEPSSSPRDRPATGLFEAPNAWTEDVSDLGKSPDSDRIIGWLADHGGWGHGELRIDFSLTVLQADALTEMREFEPSWDFFVPDCDAVPFPVPPAGALEGESGYACHNDGDCHLLVVHRTEKKLYEMWRAHIEGGLFHGGCTAVWDLTRAYPENLRGEGCSSADAGGFPITAMLFTVEEIAAGSIDHAIRFILPNSRIRKNAYVRPATHTTFAAHGGKDAPPYGVRFRLRDDFPLETLPSEGARVVARALQRYGMILADGGKMTLTGASDRYSDLKWEDVGLHPRSLAAIEVEDMEVVAMEEPIEWDGHCVRNHDGAGDKPGGGGSFPGGGGHLPDLVIDDEDGSDGHPPLPDGTFWP